MFASTYITAEARQLKVLLKFNKADITASKANPLSGTTNTTDLHPPTHPI